MDLRGVRLPTLQLSNSSFDNVGLNQAYFEFSDLNHSNFSSLSMTEASVRETIFDNARFTLNHLQNSSFKNSKLKLSSWSTTELLLFNNIDYSNCDLSESTFQGLSIMSNVQFDRANLERIVFVNTMFSSGTIFSNLNMRMVKVFQVHLIGGKFVQCNMIDAIFKPCYLKKFFFTLWQPFGMNLIKNGDVEHGQCYHEFSDCYTTELVRLW